MTSSDPNNNDPAFLNQELRKARRHNDRERVTQLCRVLIEGGIDSTHVRAALRWMVPERCYERRTTDESPLQCVSCHTPRTDEDVARGRRYHYRADRVQPEDITPEHAAQLANLARRLPDPQPMGDVCVYCYGHGAVAVNGSTGRNARDIWRRWDAGEDIVLGRCEHCQGTGHLARLSKAPASTHALCLYIDALTVAFGVRHKLLWWTWFSQSVESDFNWVLARDRDDDHPPWWSWNDACQIDRMGRVREAAVRCPELPVVPETENAFDPRTWLRKVEDRGPSTHIDVFDDGWG